MKFTDIFIRRPVLATVVSLFILVLGLRSIYFALAGMLEMFHYLPYGLSAILVQYQWLTWTLTQPRKSDSATTAASA